MEGLRNNEFLHLQQSDMSITQYDQKFVNLTYFAVHLQHTNMATVKLFEEKINLKYKNFMVSQRLNTFREVVDIAKVLERNKELEQKNKEAQAHAKAKTKDKAKGKKPFQTIEQGKALGNNDKMLKTGC